MRLEDIKGNKMREAVFPVILEEACRQWCMFIDEAPERKDGEGFADFFFEIFEEKEMDYICEMYCKEQKAEKAAGVRNHEKNRGI